jgi:Helicase HerA, central domain
LLGQHAWVTGGTGSGKTFFVLCLLLQVLARGAHPVVVVDLKGELSTLLRETFLPALAASREDSRERLQDLRVIRPFDRRFLPMLRITRPEPGVSPEIQAQAIASSIEDALGEDLGGRMIRTFLRLTRLAIERDRPLTEVLRWLEEPGALAREARQSKDPGVRRYAEGTFRRENGASIDALLARLDTFLFLPETRVCLSAPSCVSFHECLDRGITIIDLGDPPAGAERAARFWAGVLVGRLTRAILSRKVTERSPQAWVVFEEFQEALGRSQADQFGRLLALARYKRVGLCFVNQQVGQVAAQEPALVKLLRTNTGIEAAFRCSLEDARGLAHALPVPKGARSAAEARQALTEEMTRLPDRTFYLWLKRQSFRAQKVRSPRLDLAGLRTRARTIPPEVTEAIARGTVSARREELEAILTREFVHEAPHPLAGLLETGKDEGDGSFPSLG